jgi:hypothetical protein
MGILGVLVIVGLGDIVKWGLNGDYLWERMG